MEQETFKQYSLIRFESAPIRIKRNADLWFLPQTKFWNKIHEVCSTYVKSMELFPEMTDINAYIAEINTPKIVRGTGLSHLQNLRLSNNEFVELDYIYPTGKLIGKRVHAEYVRVSKEYILIDRQTVDHSFEILKVVKKNRLNTLIKGGRVRIYDVKVNTDETKIITSL